MGRKVRLTESELIKLIKKVISESKYSEEDLKYTHPRTGENCKIKIAESKTTDLEFKRFGSVLVCEQWGDEMIIAELPVSGPTFEYVRDYICDHLERTYEIIDEMLRDEEEYELSEGIDHRRWKVIDTPISCELNYDSEETEEDL
jgi:hypothetical protein